MLSNQELTIFVGIACGAYINGDSSGADKLLEGISPHSSKTCNSVQIAMAMIKSELGERDKAISILENALSHRNADCSLTKANLAKYHRLEGNIAESNSFLLDVQSGEMNEAVTDMVELIVGGSYDL